MSAYTLTDDDKKRIKECDFYIQAKTVLRSLDDYNSVNVGEVYSIFYHREGEKRYIKSHGSSEKNRYLIIEKDGGFVFGKRLNSYGTAGKDVVCLTIRFPSPSYNFELDEEQAEAIIFCEEDSFDPFNKGRVLKRKKDKIRNINKKIALKFKSQKEAYHMIKRFSVGETIWDSTTLCGHGLTEWEIVEITSRDTDKTPMYDWKNVVTGYGSNYLDLEHNKHNFDKTIILKLKCKGSLPNSRRYNSTIKEITFKDFMNNYRYYFLKKPITIEDEQIK